MNRTFAALFTILSIPALLIAADPPKVTVGSKAPEFKFKDQTGKEINLAELTKQGPVLVRLTCGCSGCDKELAYFQEIDAAYKKAGLTTVAVFKEPDAKVAQYAKDKKINMVYTVDTKGESWKIFDTKAMPTNFLINKGGEVIAIQAGCDPSGLLAKKMSEKIAKVVETDVIDVKSRVDENKKK